MARTAFDPTTHLQVFAGSRPQMDVYAKHAGVDCCNRAVATIDRLADVVHGPNADSHLNPTSYNDKFDFPRGMKGGDFETTRNDIVEFINEVGVGAKIGVLVIPNNAFVTDVGVYIYGEEAGLTFDLKTRNGLELPSTKVYKVATAADANAPCSTARTLSEDGSFEGFGALDGNRSIEIIGRDGEGKFALEADEIILEVKSMPSEEKPVNGDFGILVYVNYTIGHRAERF